MKKKMLIIFVVLIVYFALSSFTYAPEAEAILNAGNDNTQQDAEQGLGDSVDDILTNLDVKELEQFLSSLSDKQLGIFGSGSIKEKLQKIIAGEMKIDYGNFFSYICEIVGMQFLKFIPMAVAIIAIAIAFNVLSTIKSRFSASSVENIVFFACISLIIIILITQMFGIIKSTRDMVTSLQKQINIFFPIILTLMTALGASSSAAVYQPAVAVIASGLTELIIAIILPMFIISVIFTIVGNLSDGVKLKKMSGFFSTCSKWILGTSFFLFVAFLSVQGITASVYDGVSVRTAKFALSKYVPIIGGYLSEGLNLIMAGSVLVKNAIGMTAVVLLFISVAPAIIQVVVFSLTLNLAAAIIEPLGDSRISSMVSSIGKNISILIAIILGIAFLYFIFLILVICTGNLVL